MLEDKALENPIPRQVELFRRRFRVPFFGFEGLEARRTFLVLCRECCVYVCVCVFVALTE